MFFIYAVCMKNSINNSESNTGSNVWRVTRYATVLALLGIVSAKVYEAMATSDTSTTDVLGAPPMATEFELFGYSILIADNIPPQFVKIDPPKTEVPAGASVDNQ